MKTLSNNPSKKERNAYLNYIVEKINENPKKMDYYIYDLVGMQGIQLAPEDKKFKEICLFATDIEACVSPLYKNEYAISLFARLEKMIELYAKS